MGSLFAALGALLAALGPLLAALGALLGCSWLLVCRSWLLWGRSWLLMGHSQPLLGALGSEPLVLCLFCSLEATKPVVLQWFWGLGGEIRAKPFSERVGGRKLVHPNASWVPYKPFPSQKSLGNPRRGPIPPQSYAFRVPLWGPKRAPGLPGPRCGVGAPKMGSGVKNIKVAY